MQRAAPPALIINEIRLAVAQHDIPRLEIPKQKKAAIGLQQKVGERLKIVLQFLLVKGDFGEFENVIFAIIHIPQHGLPVKRGARIAARIIEIAPGDDLKARQFVQNRLVDGQQRVRERPAFARLRQMRKQRHVAEILD